MPLKAWLLDAAYLPALAGVWAYERCIKRKATAALGPRWSGFPRTEPAAKTVWLHGVSVGEVTAARGLIQKLREARPDWSFVISSTTGAGLERAADIYSADQVMASPLDFSRAVDRALNAVRPELMIFVEGDLWPNWLAALRRAQVPVAVVNAKLSARSAKRYGWLRRVAPGFFDAVNLFLVQNELYQDRWMGLGVSAERVRVSGNLKVDNLPAVTSPSQAAQMRRELGFDDELVWLAGSTHEGEEESVCRSFIELRARWPNLRLMIAPRHLERLKRIEAMASALGLKTCRKSEGCGASVILVDTMGELAELFAVADLVFLGGSLVPVGGHNLLEPAAQAKPLLFGPQVWTVRETADALVAAQAAREVKNLEELKSAVADFLNNEDSRLRAGAAARAVVDRQQGASARTAEALLELVNQVT
ncbi:MAG: 3-deoxy-D-manno-octulosonic acid transferase [Planctomycetota bacterium]